MNKLSLEKMWEIGGCDMWTVVYIAPSRTMAESLQEVLSSEGLLVMLRTIGIPHVGDSSAVEILVPESEVDEAMEILNSTVR